MAPFPAQAWKRSLEFRSYGDEEMKNFLARITPS